MERKPNIIFMLADDQGAWAMHCAGNKELNTPNLDRIAANGMRFNDFFCVSPVCSPARASLLTGNIPSAHGVHDWLCSGNIDKEKFEGQGKENPYAEGYKNEDKPIQYLKGQTCYTDLLVEDGYTCALSGKWHLGDSITPQHGFSYWYTIGRGGCCYYHPDMVENGDVIMEHGKYVTDLITDKALCFLDELSQKENPFYLSVHYTAPHSPWGEEHHPKELIEMYDSCLFESTPNVPDHPDMTEAPVYGTPRRHEYLRGYYAAITGMDRGIGKILDMVEAKGIADNTIIIFAGDNGMSMGHHGIWGKGNGTFPQNMFDTAVKVPFIVSYPPLVPKGTVCEDMVSGYDFFPTLIDLLGMQSQAATRLPGKSFLPSLKGGSSDCGDVVIFDEYGPVRMIRSKTHKYIHRYPYGDNELYDLKADPNEEHNLIGDKAYEEIVLSMRRRMEKWFLQYANPDIDGIKEDTDGSGQLCSAGIYAEKTKKYCKRDKR